MDMRICSFSGAPALGKRMSHALSPEVIRAGRKLCRDFGLMVQTSWPRSSD